MKMTKKPETMQELMKWYDNMIDELQLENEILQEENQRLQNIIDERARGQTMSHEDGLITRGNEHDLYPNEAREIVVDVLQTARQGIKDGTRRADIVDDILMANQVDGIPSLRAEAIRKVLKGYSSMDASMQRKLNELGLSIPPSYKDHYKTSYYGDGRYKFTFAVTCSDRRGGDNIAAEIIRGCF